MNYVNEIRNLNLVDLDVMELERRLELSVAVDQQAEQKEDAPWICVYKNTCQPIVGTK